HIIANQPKIMYNIIYYDMRAESNFATHIIILLMYESRRIIMEFVICDDDRLYASQFIEQLKVLESQYDELFNCVYYDHYENFMESLRNKECDKADIYFLDIEFGEVYGMDVAKIITRMNRNAGIVYITNYEEYAIKAFVCRPLGFIRKKHDAEDIKVTMDKIISYMNDKNVLYTFKNNRNTLVLNLSTVLYIEMSNHDMNIYMTDDCRVVRDKISRVEKELAAKGFVKINRSSLVNMEHIVNIKDDEVIIDNGTKLYITGNKQEMIIRDWQAYIMGYSEQ
ncbi:MAG: response regulator transcription factor, partial [Lachnospira sp.]|nr:response regulator transcription factor [Lachnospira sp.]